jgi:hypothetical protein
VVEASHFASAVLPVVCCLPAPGGGVAVVPAPGGLRAVVCAEAAGVHSEEESVASEQAHFGLAQADCSVATQAVDSVPTDYSPAVGLAPAGCLAGSQAADSVLADYSAAVGSVADDCWAVVDLVPADYSAEVGSVAGDCSAARKADDHSAPAAPLDDCSAAVDLVPADLAPAGYLAGPQAADSAPVDYSAA